MISLNVLKERTFSLHQIPEVSLGTWMAEELISDLPPLKIDILFIRHRLFPPLLLIKHTIIK